MVNALIAALFAVGVGVSAPEAPCPATWTYCDSNQWTPALCQMGAAQSPIDLPQNLVEHGGPQLQFRYGPFTPSIKNTSRSIKVTNPTGSILYAGHPYELLEFHFHVPGEHTINGFAAPMEMHLVHGIRGTGGRPDEPRVVVAVLFDDATVPLDALNPIVNALPVAECDHKDGAEINPFNLLPGNKRVYYSYNGSLTTPECSQGLKWLVLKDHSHATVGQRTKIEEKIGPNARQSRNRGTRPVDLLRAPAVRK